MYVQTGLAELLSYEVSKLCCAIEKSASDRKYIDQLITRVGVSQSKRFLLKDKRAEEGKIVVAWTKIKAWMAVQCQAPMKGPASVLVSHTDLDHVSLDDLKDSQYPWSEVVSRDLTSTVNTLLQAQVRLGHG